jgi:heat shock protein HslJ
MAVFRALARWRSGHVAWTLAGPAARIAPRHPRLLVCSALLLLWSAVLAMPGTLLAQAVPDEDADGRATARPEGVQRAAQADDGRSLEGLVWQIHEYRTAVGLKAAITGDRNGYVAFEDGGFRINAGCETLRGSYWSEDDRLLFSPHIASMLGDCPATLRAQEEAVLALLPAVTRLRTEAEDLILMDAERRPLLTLRRPETSPLQRRIWVLLAYRNLDDLIVPALPTPRFTLSFDNAAQLSGRACDDYRGGFVRDERFLRLEGPLAGAKLGCADAPAASLQAEAFLRVLSMMDSYRVDDRSLLLRDVDGRMIARFAADVSVDDATRAANALPRPTTERLGDTAQEQTLP